MPEFVLRFKDFTGGHYGVMDPAKADAKQWFGNNAQLYRSGLIGPRSGLRKLNVGTLGAPPSAGGPFAFSIIGSYLYIATDKLYRIPIGGLPDTGVPQGFTPYPAPPDEPVMLADGNPTGEVFALVERVVYRHTNALATTAVTTPVPLTHLVRWGQFLVGVDATNPWRIYHSTVDDTGALLDQWGVNDYLDVGDGAPITALVPLFNTLYVGKPNGWWTVTGVLGVRAFVRQVNNGYGPLSQRLVAATGDGRIAYWPLDSSPANFNGSLVRLDQDQSRPSGHVTIGVLRALDAGTEPEPRAGLASDWVTQQVIVTPTGRRTMFGYEDDLGISEVLMSEGSAWSRFSFTLPVAGLVPESLLTNPLLPDGVVLVARQVATAGAQPEVYAWLHDPVRPGRDGDQWAAAGDGVDQAPIRATFATNAWFDANGRVVRVRNLVAHYRSWDTKSAVPNLLRVRLVAHTDRGEQPAEWQSWREGTDYGGDGEDSTERFGFGDQGWASGFHVEVEAQGVAVRELVCLVDVRGERA